MSKIICLKCIAHGKCQAETEAPIKVSEVRPEVPRLTRTSLHAPGSLPPPGRPVHGPRRLPRMHTAMGQQGGPGREAGLFRGVSALPSTLSVLFGKLLPLPDLSFPICVSRSHTR